MLTRLSRGLFCLVAAVSAATLADPLVESASNAGLFGRGNFTDHSTVDVLPACATASLLAILYVFLRARPHVALGPLRLARVRVGPLLPAIFAAQLAVLYTMETSEQIAVAGHALGGTIWLGAPLAVALALHALACTLIVGALSRVLDGLTRAAVDVARFVRAMFVPVPASGAPAASRRVEAPRGFRMHPLASRAGKRAPPFLAA